MKKESFYLAKLEWLGPILVRGLRLLTSVEALGQEFSFSQTLILQALLMNRDWRMNDLARFLGLSKANASGLVDRLVKKGLIAREHGVEDRRVVFVRLTPSGQRVARGLARVQRQGLARMMRRVPEPNLKVFLETLEQMAMGMSEQQKDLLPPAGS
ncbi:MarR family transcriptional regulator [candidate division WOR-3 bacterium]|nr:MarR family transcriptional regulator [candidate division WOR-3 bacterium]